MFKTPTTVINELCTKSKAIPIYDLFIVTPNLRSFKEYGCKLTFTGSSLLENVTATGRARTKRDAKHLAALEALQSIDSELIDVENVRFPYAEDVYEDFSRKLRDLCEENMWPSPEYESVDLQRVNLKCFTIQCKVSTLTETGTAHSKKLAKRLASRSMFERLSNWHNVLVNPSADVNERDLFKYSKINMSDFYKITELEEKYFPLNYAIRHTWKDPADDPKLLLEVLCETSDIRFEFNRIVQSVRNDCEYCVALKMVTLPPWIVLATGATEIAAQIDASRKMLVILKTLSCNLMNRINTNEEKM